MSITEAEIKAIAKVRPKAGSIKRKRQDNNIKQLAIHINLFGDRFDLNNRMNLARFLGQTCIESDYFCTTTEYATGKAYEGRKDLGNTQAGDGVKFKGRGLIQTTGRYNTTRFHKWAKQHLADLVKGGVPDFVKDPKSIAEWPWCFFSAVYFWDEGNRTGKSLNIYAQSGNDVMITKVINGGLTHYEERLDATVRACLTFLGYMTSIVGIRDFQEAAGITVDGIVGNQTIVSLDETLREDVPKPYEPKEDEAPPPEPNQKTRPSWISRFFSWLFS